MKRTIVIQCQRCQGTGITIPLSPMYQVGFVCENCGGSGKVDFSYEDFEGLKRIEGVKRVFVKDPVSKHQGEEYQAEDQILSSGEILHYSEYGCDYEDFLKGEQPKPMEELYCPMYYGICGKGRCSRCDEGLKECGYIHRNIVHCLFWQDKAKCWEEFHQMVDNETNSQK